jgi:hypothetical protein
MPTRRNWHPRPKPEMSDTPWAISRNKRGAQRRKPKSCPVRALCYPLAAIPENDRQRMCTEEGANCTCLRRLPMAGEATACVGATAHARSLVARSPQLARRPAYGEFPKCFYVASHVAYVLYMYMDSLMCNKSKKRSTARAQRG